VNPVNPVRGTSLDHEWARLPRLAGDRAAILLEDLRARISRLAGLIEELHRDPLAEGWLVSYRVGENILSSIRVRPGLLEAILPPGASLRTNLLSSPKISGRLKDKIRAAPLETPSAELAIQLSGSADVRAFAALVMIESKLIVSAGKSGGSG
jgi:hypothetical protein